MIDLLYDDLNQLALHAEPAALLQAVEKIDAWSDRHGEVLDYIYRYRLTRLLVYRAGTGELAELNDHLARVAHDLRREALAKLTVDYHARWNGYRDILEHRLAALEDTRAGQIAGRYVHVAAILREVTTGGGLSQKQLQEKLDLGKANLSRILDLMEANELIHRRKVGRENQILPGINAGAALSADQPTAPQVAEPANHYSVSAPKAKRGSAYLLQAVA